MGISLRLRRSALHMNKIKAFFKHLASHLHVYVLWSILSAFLWMWIFGFVTDTTTFHKVSVYIDCHTCEELDLTLELEKDLPDGIKMVKVHPLQYVVFDEPTMLMGDIMILRACDLENYRDFLCPITLAAHRFDRPTYKIEDEVYGIQVYDGASGQGILCEYVSFLAPDEEPQNFYMVFLNKSRHLGQLNGSDDEAAFDIALRLLEIG